jgi:glutaryl-CoA dehydrogenase (non-decarboxylating)
MDFSLTPEHEMTRRMVRDFAEREVAPIIKEYDRAQKANLDVLARMAELGLLGICIPTRYGGAGMDYVCLGLACEELERVDTSLRVVMSVHVGLNSLGLLQWSIEEQKQRWLVPQARGERNAKGACIYEGSSQVHELIQAGYALGYREDRPLRCELPAYDPDEWQSSAQ